VIVGKLRNHVSLFICKMGAAVPFKFFLTEFLKFIFGCAGSLLLCRLFSSFGEQVLLFFAVHRILLWWLLCY
ncbi:hypothetical protein ACX3U9_00990, partial [Corynebacterium pyruviciproducens]